MLFKVNNEKSTLEHLPSKWNLSEYELENYLVPAIESNELILNPNIFGEELLLIDKQVTSKDNKRADILALDKFGNAVIIELKRDEGKLSVETQALQYLAYFSAYKGSNFISHFSSKSSYYETKDAFQDAIKSYIGDDFEFEEVNKTSRVILIAGDFDRTLFSMGKWLSEYGIAFRCIQYVPYEIAGENYLSFSIKFDQSPASLYSPDFHLVERQPQYFWHNIGRDKKDSQKWWKYLLEKGQISTSFTNQTDDEGETILRNYHAGDKIIAYASGYGALGWGEIEDAESYKLLAPSENDYNNDKFHLHRLNISWKACTSDVTKALSAGNVKEEFGIFHPIRASVRISDDKAIQLINRLENIE